MEIEKWTLKWFSPPHCSLMKHKAEEIVAKLRQVDVLLSQGRTVGEAVRSIGVTQFTYYRWRKELVA